MRGFGSFVVRFGFVLSAFAIITSNLHAADLKTIRIASADTALTFQAGSDVPQLSQLTLVGGETWKNQAPEALIDHVEVNGQQKLLHWQLNASACRIKQDFVQIVYDSQSPRLRLFWEWRVRVQHGPLEHSIRIQNLSSKELWLPLQDSVRFDWHVAHGEPLKQFWIEKGADRPSAAGTHEIYISDGYSWSGKSSTYAHPADNQPREIIPYLLVEHAQDEQSGWYIGIEFSGRTRITLMRTGDSVRGAAGLNPVPGPFVMRVPAGSSFVTPTVFIGAFQGGPDAAGNILRGWIRQVLSDPFTVHNSQFPLLTNNTWGSGMEIDEAQARRMIQNSADLGLEMFHLDAGWFRGVGDWYPDPKKFPHGLAPIADYAHAMGLKFGLWVDWTQAGLDKQPGALNVFDPKIHDWLTVDPSPNWVPAEAFKGITIDIGEPAAHEWAAKEVDRLVRDYHLDMLEHDGYLVAQGCIRTNHPHAPPDPENTKQYKDSGFSWVESSNSTDVSYHATQAYYDIYSRLRQKHPGLLLEICNDGGRMVDFGSAAHGDYFSITDAYDPLSNRRAFYDASYVLPPAMLESYVEKWPATRIENFRYMLRSGMMGWFSLMTDSTAWSQEQRLAAREAFALYKSQIRPLIRDADLYHVSARPDGVHWDGIEYFATHLHQGVLFAFHGSGQEEKTHRFVLQGLHPDRIYHLHFQDHSSQDQTVYGRVLMQKGIQVSLPIPNSSELVFLQEVD